MSKTASSACTSEMWKAFDPGFDLGVVPKREANVQGSFGVTKGDYGAADVREANCTGNIGEADFVKLAHSVQTPMKATQAAWRAAVVGLAVAPLAILKVLISFAADADSHIAVRIACALAMPLCFLPARKLAQNVIMVKKAEVVFVQLVEDGTTQILMAGIHVLPGLGSELKRFKVTEDDMRCGTMTLVRVRPSFIGLGTDNGKPVFLLPGLHLYNAPNFEFAGVKSVNDNFIQNGPLKVVRVPPGQVGLAKINGEPLLLEEGVHFIDEVGFVMERDGWKKVDEMLVELGPLKIIVVPRGSIAPVLVNGEGHFLLEGRHFVNQGRFKFLGIFLLSDEYICAGTRHRILVPSGKLGCALEAGEPVLLEPGQVHLKNSALFSYVGSSDITQQVITHGALNIVTVKDGQFGISYKDGVIDLLSPGRHYLTSATHIPGGFINAGQQTLRISEVTGMSSDMVELRFDAAICMRVVDALKAVVMLTQGRRDLMAELQANMQERAKLALSIIIGNNCLNKKHGATAMSAKANGEKEDDPASDFVKPEEEVDDSSFRRVIHDKFMVDFSKSMVNECGVQVIDMSIEDVVIVNKELATAMASAAVANSSLERTQIDAEIVQVKAKADARVALIEARGKGEAMEITARAEAQRIKTISEALENSGDTGKKLELVRASGASLSRASTVMLAQDTGALATLLAGAQGSQLGPKLK